MCGHRLIALWHKYISQYSMQDLLREFVDLRGIEKSFEHSAFHIVISSFHHILFFVMKAGVPCNSGRNTLHLRRPRPATLATKSAEGMNRRF